MNLFLFIIQVILFFLCFWIFKKKNIDFCKLTEKINEKIFIGIMILLSISLPFLYIGEGHSWGGDFSCYIAQAQSILTGTMKEQVEANTFIVTSSNFMHGPGSYPWGYPLLLTPVIKIFGVNYIALKCVNVVFFALSILAFYKLLKGKVSLGYARFATFFLVMNPVLLSMCNQVLSDIPFFFFSIISVYFIDRMFLSEKNQIFYGVASGLSCFLAYFIRTNGIVAVLTIAAIEFLLLILKIKPLRKFRSKLAFPKQKPLAHIAAYAVFVSGAILDKLIFPTGGSDYGYYFRFFSKSSLISNFREYTGDCLNFLSMNLGKAFPILFVLALLFVYSIKKELHKEMVSFVYIAGMFALVVIFPTYQGIRYLVTILPFILMLCAEALDDFERDVIGDNNVKDMYRIVAGVFLCIIVCSFAFKTAWYAKDVVKDDIKHRANTSYSEMAIETYDYIKANTEEDDIIAFFKPRVLWLNTQRKGFSIGESNIEQVENVDYVLFEKSSADKALKEYCKTSETAEIVFQNDKFIMYSIDA